MRALLHSGPASRSISHLRDRHHSFADAQFCLSRVCSAYYYICVLKKYEKASLTFFFATEMLRKPTLRMQQSASVCGRRLASTRRYPGTPESRAVRFLSAGGCRRGDVVGVNDNQIRHPCVLSEQWLTTVKWWCSVISWTTSNDKDAGSSSPRIMGYLSTRAAPA